MVDWKKIRDEERKLDDAYMAFGEADYGERFGSSIEEGVAEEQRDEYRATNFPSLISALEEQEKALEELIRRIERAEAHYGKPRDDNPNEDFHQGQSTAFGKCVQMLREVLQ